jgi:hypothetical protein
MDTFGRPPAIPRFLVCLAGGHVSIARSPRHFAARPRYLYQHIRRHQRTQRSCAWQACPLVRCRAEHGGERWVTTGGQGRRCGGDDTRWRCHCRARAPWQSWFPWRASCSARRRPTSHSPYPSSPRTFCGLGPSPPHRPGAIGGALGSLAPTATAAASHSTPRHPHTTRAPHPTSPVQTPQRQHRSVSGAILLAEPCTVCVSHAITLALPWAVSRPLPTSSTAATPAPLPTLSAG